MTEQIKPARRPRRMAREPLPESTAAEGKAPMPNPASARSGESPTRPTKTDLLLSLLRRDEGATLEQMVAATGWLSHTTRAALTGLKKKGHAITSEKVDGVRTYRDAACRDAV